MTINEFIKWLGTQKGKFEVESCGLIRHKRLRAQGLISFDNGAASCPLNAHPKARVDGPMMNSDIDEMGEAISLKKKARNIACAADGEGCPTIRKRMLKALGLKEPK